MLDIWGKSIWIFNNSEEKQDRSLRKKGCAMLPCQFGSQFNLKHKDMINLQKLFLLEEWKFIFSPILILEMERLSQTVSVWQIFFRLNQTFGSKSFINQSTVKLFSVMKSDFFLFYKHSWEPQEFSSGWIYKLEEHFFHE